MSESVEGSHVFFVAIDHGIPPLTDCQRLFFVTRCKARTYAFSLLTIIYREYINK